MFTVVLVISLTLHYYVLFMVSRQVMGMPDSVLVAIANVFIHGERNVCVCLHVKYSMSINCLFSVFRWVLLVSLSLSK